MPTGEEILESSKVCFNIRSGEVEKLLRYFYLKAFIEKTLEFNHDFLNEIASLSESFSLGIQKNFYNLKNSLNCR